MVSGDPGLKVRQGLETKGGLWGSLKTHHGCRSLLSALRALKNHILDVEVSSLL